MLIGRNFTKGNFKFIGVFYCILFFYVKKLNIQFTCHPLFLLRNVHIDIGPMGWGWGKNRFLPPHGFCGRCNYDAVEAWLDLLKIC